ncbi:MAG: hypothetical protein M3070_05935 [Actinomycetota bacterium]|nr:hypothetical protein [Actinomycetota bacterium]
MTRPTNRVARKLRAHRQNRQFERTLRFASPAVQQELLAAAARQNYAR